MNIQIGDRVTYKYKNITDKQEFTSIIETSRELEDYKKMIESEEDFNSIQILKIERPKYEIVEEKEELLTEEEKEFLKSYIKLIESLNNGYIKNISKLGCYLVLLLENDLTYEVEIGAMFKNLTEDEHYTLEELLEGK